MNDKTITAIVGVLTAVIGVAILALLVSRQSNTGGVLGAFGQTISKMLCTALGPVMGGNCGREQVDSSIVFH